MGLNLSDWKPVSGESRSRDIPCGAMARTISPTRISSLLSRISWLCLNWFRNESMASSVSAETPAQDSRASDGSPDVLLERWLFTS